MDKEQIIEAIRTYIDDKNANYAIMINGTWGCGKTFLYKNDIATDIKTRENGKNVKDRRFNLYISLYGVDSLEALSKSLFTQYLVESGLRGKGKKAVEITEEVMHVTGSIISASAHGISYSFKDIGKHINTLEKKLLKPQKMVICFDDLERSTIPVPVIMGYINNLTEHCGCKVIILADEGNIGKVYANTNVESKYGVVLSGGRLIDFTAKPATGKEETPDGSTALSIDALKKNTERVFSENYIYKDIKEKVVGKTLFYTPRFEIVYDDVLKKRYMKEGLELSAEGKYLVDNKAFITSVFNKCNCKNLRILLSWLRSFPNIMETVDDQGIDKKYVERFRKAVLRYSICYICARLMNDDLKIAWNPDMDYSNVIGAFSFDGETAEAFGFVDDLIDSGSPDKRAIRAAVSEFVDRKKAEDDKTEKSEGVYLDLLCKTASYMDDDELEDAIDKLLEEIKSGKYIFSDYREIFEILNDIIQEGLIDDRLEEFANILKESVQYNTISKGYNPEKEFYALNDEEEKRYDFYKPIEDEILKKIEGKNRAKGNENSIYRNFDSFAKYVQEGKQESFVVRRGFFRYLNISKLMALMENLDREDVYSLSQIILGVYAFYNADEIFADDAEALEEFKERVSTCKIPAFEGRTGKVARRSFIQDLDMIIERL